MQISETNNEPPLILKFPEGVFGWKALLILGTIETGLQHWARFKRQNSSWSDLNINSRLGVTASPGSLISDDEIPKPGDQDLILTLKGFFDDIEDGFHNLGHFFI